MNEINFVLDNINELTKEKSNLEKQSNKLIEQRNSKEIYNKKINKY